MEPAVTGIDPAVFVTDISAEVDTSVLTVAALLPLFESPVVELTVAVSVRVVPDAVVAGTVTTNVNGPTVVLVARFDPSVQVRVPRLQVHPVGPVRAVGVLPAGGVSTIFGVVADAGPEFVTVWVYVMLLPAITGFVLPEFVMLRSACVPDVTAMLTVAVLLLVVD